MTKKYPSISRPLIRAKAEEFAYSIGENDFEASTCWLDGLKKIHIISFQNYFFLSGSVDVETANSWKDDLLQIISNREDKDIFNIETGLFFNCIPDKILTFTGECCSGEKHSKELITLFVGANMGG